MTSKATASKEMLVNTETTSNQSSASLTALADGGWVAAWHSNDQDGGGRGIYLQRYDADGQMVGTEEQVNTSTTGDQHYASTTSLADGGWLVLWYSSEQDGTYQQRYHADGTEFGDETLVKSGTYESSRYQAIATALADGWVVTWTLEDEEGDIDGDGKADFVIHLDDAMKLKTGHFDL